MSRATPRPPKHWPESASELAQWLHNRTEGVEEALALAFTPTLRFDANSRIHLEKPRNQLWERCDNLLLLLLLSKPYDYEHYILQLLNAGFSFEGIDHYAIMRELVRQPSTELLEACLNHGLNPHATAHVGGTHPQNQHLWGHNALLDSIHQEDPMWFHRLLALGLSPHIPTQTLPGTADQQKEYGLIVDAFSHCGASRTVPEVYLDMPMTLFRMGCCKLRYRDSDTLYFIDPYDHTFSLTDGTPFVQGGASERGDPPHWKKKRFNAFELAIEEMSARLDQMKAGKIPITEYTPQDMYDAYTLDQLKPLCEPHQWRGHEQHFSEIYTQLPPYMQAEIALEATSILLCGEPASQVDQGQHGGLLAVACSGQKLH